MFVNKDDIATISSSMVDYRQLFHSTPEVGFKEFETAKFIQTFLNELNIPFKTGYATTGIVATIDGIHPGREICLRCDMDALHIDEKNDLPYASKNPGVMHACGHDGHMAMMLGVAKYLTLHNDFSGKVHLLFQPAEESYGGAKYVINDGIFDDYPNIEAIYGLHNWPKVPLGTLASTTGAMMACSDTWEMKVTGSGGHGAMPHEVTDPTLATSNIIMNLQSIVSRNVHCARAGVVSVGYINAGKFESPNIIPSQVQLRGTARAYEPEVRDLIEQRIGEIASASAQAHGCEIEYNYIRRYPAVYNPLAQFEIVAQAARATVGTSNFNAAITPVGGAEDFAFYLEKIPGAFMFLGNGDSDPLHTPGYNFNDEIIPVGIEYFINVIKTELG
ncbi:amidohydrolase [Photobacterium nomapromontoriensis]|uniref:amidohydrolase n=1 Tax=Photobacterium nomapromontoriensis TaxID=2910237 RepID=UPI003D0BEF57